MIDKILEDLVEKQRVVFAADANRTIGRAAGALTGHPTLSVDMRRDWLVSVAAHAVAAIAEIDAEAERGKYLEQAQALFDMARLLNQDFVCVYLGDGEVRIAPMSQGSAWKNFQVLPEDESEHVESLARVLQERAEKSQ